VRKIRLLDEAYLDLQTGHLFYEKQATGLGVYFLDSLIADIDSLAVYAGIHPICIGRYYRMLSKRFPFAIYYRIQSEEVLVYAVLDCRRKPAWVRERLS
jgi:hypothetical protein